MVNIFFLFWLLVFIFASIGMMRGWAKELLVTFSIILALFLLSLLERYIPFVRMIVESKEDVYVKYTLWVRIVIVVLIAFFGYQAPLLQRFVGTGKLNRERFQDALLGLFIGFANGFLIVGTLWYYLDQAKYPYPHLISLPSGEQRAAIERLVTFLPPRWLGIPGIYFAVAVAFVFVLIVFI